jgi:predicted enzyme related to lactoylglutathione lyase
MVRELAFVAYYVRDMQRARRFYGETLGLPRGELFNDDWVEFDLGNATFALDGSGEALGIMPGSSSGAAFEVDDIAAMRARLIEAGAQATEIHEFPPCWASFARDPEGNHFTIHQRKKNREQP